ncbi:xylulokinase [Meiothermus sp. Pnk-1]|uniref:xylulokinase n=1 Tax=Meiothermus sp. Pnk-1 TaxID=873128 RepID=UPI000D7C6C04|nr:xylulokinase [Meiothermus sp. Pnk-1]PZA07507.1 xylulokinase [Meiothermus sp. Pnk-1]
MKRHGLLGLDIGTSGCKGLLVSLEGRVLGAQSAEHPLLVPRPGWAEQEPEVWWEASVAVLKRLAEQAEEQKIEILALGLTGQMHGAVFLDSLGNPIRPALLWNDGRTAGECREIEERVGPQRLREIAGNPALTGFQAPKILWLRKNEPEAYARVRHLLLPKDFIRYRLTGGFATDASDAAGTLLLDLARRDYSPEILGALEIPPEWLPSVHEGPQITGYVSPEAARRTGLPAGLPVAAGGGDNAAAAVGSGVVREGTASVSVGTSGVIFAPSDRLRLDPEGALHAFCHAVPGKYHLMGVVLSAGGSLRWYRDTLAGEEVAAAQGAGRDPYEVLMDQAGPIPAGAEGLYFLPYLAGERTPHLDPQARGGWVGLSLAHRKGHLVRAILEGVAFALKDSLVRITALGIQPEALRTVGGGMRSPLWRAIVAATLEAPLQGLEVEEGPAFGAALLAGVGVEVYPDVDEAVAKAVRLKPETTFPDPRLAQTYQELYRQYIRLYPALKESGVFRVHPK